MVDDELKRIIEEERAERHARSVEYNKYRSELRKSKPDERAKEYAREVKRLEKKAGRPRPNTCEVCSATDVRIAYDHDHETNMFRGWLCNGCNVAIALTKESPETLEKLAVYLRTHKGIRHA